MGKTAITGYTESSMRAAGKKDGRLWRWSIMPWFIVAKEPLPQSGKPARKISELAEAAEEMLSGVLSDWHKQNGSMQKLAQRAVDRMRTLDAGDPTMSSHVAKSRTQYSDARIDRRTAWRVARAEADAIQQRYSELGQTYVHANHVARRDMKVDIPIPNLDAPVQLSESGFVPMERALGLQVEELGRLGLMPDTDSDDMRAALAG